MLVDTKGVIRTRESISEGLIIQWQEEEKKKKTNNGRQNTPQNTKD
jgi:hypothetical protein